MHHCFHMHAGSTAALKADMNKKVITPICAIISAPQDAEVRGVNRDVNVGKF